MINNKKEEEKKVVQEERKEEEKLETNWTEKIEKFDDLLKLSVKQELLRGIYGYGFEKPSYIQQYGILPLIKGKDTIAQAQSGTGKTGTFAIALLHLIDPQSPYCQAMILSPTRELAQQTASVVRCLGEHMKIKIHTLIGGTNVQEDRRILKEGGIQAIVGTPGRIQDMLGKGFLNSQHFKLMILDEADELLSRGFKDQISQIIQTVPGDIQIGLFSATMAPGILNISKQFMRNPAVILVKNEELTLDGIKQYFIAIEREELKFPTLKELYKNLNIAQAIIYLNKKERVQELQKKCEEEQIITSQIHSEMSQDQRDQIMKEFRTGTSRIMLSTDLLSRGIDVQAISLVINYDLPIKKENYIHRIGRSGRFGRKGVAINFVTQSDAAFLNDVEQFYSTKIEELPMDVTKLLE